MPAMRNLSVDNLGMAAAIAVLFGAAAFAQEANDEPADEAPAATSEEIEEIAEQDVPLTQAVTNITIHQLEQAVNLERAFRFGEKMQQNEHAAEQFALAVKKFHELAVKVDEELKEGEKLAAEAIDILTQSEARSTLERMGTFLIERVHAARG